MEVDVQRDFRPHSGGGIDTERAAKLASSLLHHENPEVNRARVGLCEMESTAIVADGEIQRIVLVLQADLNLRSAGMPDGV